MFGLVICALFVAAFEGCNKKDEISNDAILKKPFSLYVGAQNGSVYLVNSMDTGTLVFPIDGFPIHAMLTSGKNILFAKGNLFLSDNNGVNFNLTYNKTNPVYLGLPIFYPWPSLMIDAVGHGRIYVSSIEGKGIVYSEDNGKNWQIDAGWDGGVAGGGITSFAQLKNGTLFAHAILTDSLYRRANKGANWVHVKQTNLPTSGAYSISSYNDELLAMDLSGINGVYHSPDGITWTAYQGLPNRRLYVASAPFNQRLLVGTDSMGIYRLEGNIFVPTNNGLATNTTVYGFAGKDDIYKNETRRYYIYTATDRGLYRSLDGGLNWVKVLSGKFTTVY